MKIDWDEVGTLRQVVGGYDIRTDPLWILVITAKQGHEGPLEDMQIEMTAGLICGPAEIQELALRSDRRRA